jgi:hypothetical protein
MRIDGTPHVPRDGAKQGSASLRKLVLIAAEIDGMTGMLEL